MSTSVPEPPLADKEVLEKYQVVSPTEFAREVLEAEGNGAIEKARRWETGCLGLGFEPMVIGWPTGEYCYVSCQRQSAWLPIIEITDRLILQAYEHSRNRMGPGPLIVSRSGQLIWPPY